MLVSTLTDPASINNAPHGIQRAMVGEDAYSYRDIYSPKKKNNPFSCGDPNLPGLGKL